MPVFDIQYVQKLIVLSGPTVIILMNYQQMLFFGKSQYVCTHNSPQDWSIITVKLSFILGIKI